VCSGEARVLSVARAWEVLAAVADPEIPVVSVTELGIVRDVKAAGETLTVVLTPTYSGCPATAAIETAIRDALREAGAGEVRIETRLAPPWTTDWLDPAAAEKLRQYGIAPPGAAGANRTVHVVRRDMAPRAPVCPRCGSSSTERLSEFGATACKALYRCTACREPFEHFKPI
jgi:ring-1,2-phenylacetyl-CoA epoxidase subunit PaaD